MKCLSIRQPWVYRIFHEGKDIENRTWPTKFRGRFLVHASKTPDKSEGWDPEIMPISCIVGTVELVDCVTDSDSEWYYGGYGFVLAKPRLFLEPIPYKGKLFFFDVPDELVRHAVETSVPCRKKRHVKKMAVTDKAILRRAIASRRTMTLRSHSSVRFPRKRR